MSNSVFLTPRSIAIIGASDREGSVGRTITSNIIREFSGKVYPITPSREKVFDHPAFKSVLDVEASIDLAVIVTNNRLVAKVLEECGEKGIRGAIIVTSGFKEVDAAGREMEEELTRIAKKYDIEVVGPNCLGVMNLDPAIMLNATFLKFTPRSGDIALVSQSGAVCAALVENASAQGIGFSAIFSMGNKAVLGETEILGMLADHDATRVVVMYLEDITQGAEFLKVCRDITRNRKKPVLVLKAGRSMLGARAAMSHTGAMMGSDRAVEALLAQAGAIRVNTLSQLFDYASAFSMQPIPEQDGAVILSNAGGAAIVSTDACERMKVPLADITPVRPEIDALIPPWGSSRNPIDIVGDANEHRFASVLDTVLARENVGAVVAMCTPSGTLDYDGLAGRIVDAAGRFGKTLLTSLMGDEEGEENRRILREGGIPHYRYAEDAVSALGAMLRFRRWLNTKPGMVNRFKMDGEKISKILNSARESGRDHLLETEGQALLRAAGFPVPGSEIARSRDEAVTIAGEIGYPVVMKVVSPRIIHKSDAGGVLVGLESEAQVREGYDAIIANAAAYDPKAGVEGVLVMEMVAGGVEMIAGAREEPGIGPVIMLGTGGIHVEVFRDVTFRVAPVTDTEVTDMMAEIQGSALLDGVRGAPPADRAALAQCLARVAQLVVDFPQIGELDINPVRVLEKGKGCRVLDIRIGLE